MSILTSRVVPEQPSTPEHQLSPRNEQKAHALGLTSATAPVIGSIVGTGAFTMPAMTAGAGTMSLVALGNFEDGGSGGSRRAVAGASDAESALTGLRRGGLV